MQASGGWRLTAVQGAHGPRCTRVPCVQAAGVAIIWRSRHIDARDEIVEVRKGLVLLLIFWCSDIDLVPLRSTPQVVTVYLATEKGLPKITHVLENGGAREPL